MIEQHHITDTEAHLPDSSRNLRRAVHERLRTNRMTYRDFIRALMHLGVVIETNKHGSGHVILRHGQRSAAIVSGARKVSDGWQPRDIKNILRRLEIPEERFLTAITNAGLRVAKEYEGSPNAVEVCDE